MLTKWDTTIRRRCRQIFNLHLVGEAYDDLVVEVQEEVVVACRNWHWRRRKQGPPTPSYVQGVITNILNRKKKVTSAKYRRMFVFKDPATIVEPAAPEPEEVEVRGTEAVHALRSTMNPRAFSLLVLRYVYDMRPAEIAERCDIDVKQVRAGLYSAKDTARNRMRALGAANLEAALKLQEDE